MSNLFIAFSMAMGPKLYGALGLVLIILIIILFLVKNRDKKPDYIKKLLKIPFPDSWKEILATEFPIYKSLPKNTKQNLEKHIQVFIGTKEFEGRDEFVITDEVRLLIAAQASLLICNMDKEFASYQKLATIFVYPQRFQLNNGNLETVDGISLPPFLDDNGYVQGEIHLSWEDVSAGIADGEDGYNPVFRHFAHQLDQEDMDEDGVPAHHINDTIEWLKVWNSYFIKFQNQVNTGKDTLIHPSAAQSLPEFFAVATEYFFETPKKMKKDSPGLYEKLKTFYKQDPAQY